jgi:uncharacterized protein (DUF1499 family)
MGLFHFAGKRPVNLGLAAGKLRPGDGKPNWVSSQVSTSDKKHYIEPIRSSSSAGAAWKKLADVVNAMPGATRITNDAGYMHVEFASALMGFVDDVEFAPDAGAGVIHVRSGARVGYDDFGVNRKRIETIRAALR